MELTWVRPLRNTDHAVCQFGRESCTPSHSYGPAMRDHFLLHFITEGEGSFSHAGREYRLGKGEGFLITPGEVAYYEADAACPWSYVWVGFLAKDGKLMKDLGLTPTSPTFRFSGLAEIERIFEEMGEADETRADGQLRLTGYLFMLLSAITPHPLPAKEKPDLGVKKDYVERAILYIRQNYALPITVAEIASHLGIHRAYFATLFKEHTHFSPRTFILNTRIGRAKELLEDGKLSILSVARSVGYEDALLFSKTFKKATGLSPREYRKAHINESQKTI